MRRKLSEEATRNQIIDPQLESAGWYLCMNALRELQSTSAEELRRFLGRTLMSPVLDRAFKGEL